MSMCNKSFSGNSSILSRSNFGVGGQESRLQSLTVHSKEDWEKTIKAHKESMMAIIK